MRRSRVLLAAIAAGGAFAAKRAYDAKVASWDTNDDPTQGDPLGLPDGEVVETAGADGARLHGYRTGDRSGPTIVLVHGFIESIAFWGPVARRLDGFDVLIVDQRGHGASERGTAPYTTATLADDLRAWFEQHDLTDVTLVGHSMGGVAAMAFASDQAEVAAERTRSLVLVTTLASPVQTPGVAGGITPERALAVMDRVMRRPNLGLFALLGTFGTRPSRVALETTRAAVLGCDPISRRDAFVMLQDFDLRDTLADIALPTLVIAGSHDGLTPLAVNEIIAETIPGARLEVVHGRGHMLMFEAPDQLTDLIVQATKPADVAG